MLLIRNARFARWALLTLVALILPLRAETEAEFVARVTEAWNSKDVEKVLSLYGEKAIEDPDFRKREISSLEWDFKNRRLESACLVPYMPGDGTPRFMKGKIYFSSSKWKALVMNMASEGAQRPKINASIRPVVQNADGSFVLATSEVKSFDWTGPELDRFNVTITSNSIASFPPVVVVFESCGRISWSKMDAGSFGFRAHKIQQMIIPALEESDPVTIEITRNEETKAFVTKTVDASKGAIVPIELP